MAEKRTINIDIKNNADETAKDFDTLNKSIDQTTKSTKNLDATFEEVYGDLQPLTSRMGEAEDRLYELSLAGDTTSKEFQELLTKVGQYRKVQMDTDLVVDAAATTLGQKLGGALGGATAGFSLATGAMGLMGSESEELEKLLLKVQSALAIQQGFEGIRQAIPSFKQLGNTAKVAFSGMTKASKAFAITGIGLVLTAIALVISMTDDMGDSEGELEEKRKQREEEEKARHQQYLARKQAKLDAIQKESDLEVAELDRARRLALSEGKSVAEFEKKILEEKLEAIQKTGEELVKENKELLESEKELIRWQNIYLKNIPYETAADAKSSRASIKSIENQLVTLRARNKEIIGLVDDEKEKRKDALVDIDIHENTIVKEKSERWKDYSDLRLSIARRIQDGETDLMEDGEAKDIEISRIRFERQIEDIKRNSKINGTEKIRLEKIYEKQAKEAVQKIKDKYDKIDIDREKKRLENIANQNNDFLDTIAEIEEQNYQNTLSDEERELRAVQDKYFALEEAAQDNAEALNEIEISRLNAENEIYLKFDNERAANQKVIDDKAKADAQALADAKIDIGVKGLQLIAGIADAFAGEDEKRQKKAFQIKKVADIAAATVDGYRAVLSTYAQTPGGIVLKTIAATIAGGFAALQIGNIASAEFGGGGGDVESSASAGGGEVSAPSFNVVGDSGINQLASLQQQPVQAYVEIGRAHV